MCTRSRITVPRGSPVPVQVDAGRPVLLTVGAAGSTRSSPTPPLPLPSVLVDDRARPPRPPLSPPHAPIFLCLFGLFGVDAAAAAPVPRPPLLAVLTRQRRRCCYHHHRHLYAHCRPFPSSTPGVCGLGGRRGVGLGAAELGGRGTAERHPGGMRRPLGRGARAALRVAALGAFNVGVLGVYLAVVERSKRRGGSYERDGYEFWGAWRRLPRHLREGEGEAGEQTGGTLPASTASLPTPPTPPLPPGGAATAAAARPPPGGRAA